MKEHYFSGPFAPMCELFVAQKRAAGLKYIQQAMLLHMFDDFCKDYSIREYEITEEIAVAWSERRPNEKDSSRHSRIAEMQRFSVFLCSQGYRSYLMPVLPKISGRHYPYIFTEEEIKRLLGSIDGLEASPVSPFRHLVYPCLVRFLYGCGMRVMETLELQKKDVDTHDGVIHVRHAKNNGERLVPMSKSLLEHCRKYVSEAHADSPETMPFFYTRSHEKYSSSTVRKAFRGFLWDAGIPYRGKDAGPRLHDLRHTFVCHNIKNWAENGVSIKSRLPVLSRYLGHSSVESTEWYLHLTAEVYPHIRDICSKGMDHSYRELLQNYVREENKDEP